MTAKKLDRRLKYRLGLLVSMALIVPLGYVVRFSQSAAPDWMHDAFGSIAYEIFWVLLATFCWPNTSLLLLAIAVCLATCAIEVLQLLHPAWLEALRATLPGRLVLGTTFNWADFPAYFGGSGLGWWWAEQLQHWRDRS